MSHGHVVGAGKHLTHLVKRPTAAQHRAHLKAKMAPHLKKAVTVAQVRKPVVSPLQQQVNLLTLKQINSDQKTDAIAYLNRQHDLWYADLMQWHLAVNQAEKLFTSVINSKTPPSLGEAILGALVQMLIFTVLPELGPIKFVAEKLCKSDEARKKLAEVAVEATKLSIEQFKKSTEEAEATDDKKVAEQLGIKFFGKIYKDISYFVNAITNAINALSESITTGDPAELPAKIPQVYFKWAASGFARDPKQKAAIEADQLALYLLYGIMRAWCKQCVSLKAPYMRHLPPDKADKIGFFTSPATEMSAHMNVPISKEEFRQARREDPDFDVEFENLDSARREQMYKYFRDIRWWGSAQFPKILAPADGGRGWLDLIEAWEFKKE